MIPTRSQGECPGTHGANLLRFSANAPRIQNFQPVAGPRYFMPSVTDTFSYRARKPEPASKTTVESLLGGGQIFNRVDDILDQAHNSVLIDLYNFQSPAIYPEKSSPKGMPGANIQAGLVDKLIDLKKNKGVDVKVIIDNHWDPEFKEGYNDRTIAVLRKAGIDVVTYPKFSTISHVKVLIVDDQFAVLGGMNWGNHSATNHDAAVFIKGPDVRNICNEVFKPDWVSCGRDEKELPQMAPFAQGKIKILQTTARQSTDGAKDEIFREILNQIDNAQESIYAELFTLTQANVTDALLAAHKRLTKAGKEGVKILVDPGLFFAFPACRVKVQALARAGVPIQFFKTNRDIEEKLHAKWAVFDRKRLLIGSANWSNAGLLSNGKEEDAKPPLDIDEDGKLERVSKSNHEVALLMELPKVAQNFANQLMYDWKNAAFPILEYRAGKWRKVIPGSKPPPADQGVPKPKYTGKNLLQFA